MFAKFYSRFLTFSKFFRLISLNCHLKCYIEKMEKEFIRQQCFWQSMLNHFLFFYILGKVTPLSSESSIVKKIWYYFVFFQHKETKIYLFYIDLNVAFSLKIFFCQIYIHISKLEHKIVLIHFNIYLMIFVYLFILPFSYCFSILKSIFYSLWRSLKCGRLLLLKTQWK